MKLLVKVLPLLATTIGFAAPLAAQTLVGNTADALIDQGTPNVVTSTGSVIYVGFNGSSGVMGQNAVFVFALPNLPANTSIATSNLSIYYGGKGWSGTHSPDFNGDLYGLNYRTAATVQASDYFMGSSDTALTATLIQDNYVSTSFGNSGFTLNTDTTGDDNLSKYLNVQLAVSATQRANGSTAYVFLRVNPDLFGYAYTRYRLDSAENSSQYQPKITFTTTTNPRFFAPTAFWNRSVTTAALDADQSDVQRLLNQVTSHPPVGNTYLNRNTYSTPIYVMPSDAPTYKVTGNSYMSGWDTCPWPNSPTPWADGNDKHMVVWQPSTDRYWEFWGCGGTATVPTARAGGFIRGQSTSSGVFPSPVGATATGLALAGGLITLEEAEKVASDPNYTIPHALALAVTASYPNPTFVAPATRADGSSGVTVTASKRDAASACHQLTTWKPQWQANPRSPKPSRVPLNNTEWSCVTYRDRLPCMAKTPKPALLIPGWLR